MLTNSLKEHASTYEKITHSDSVAVCRYLINPSRARCKVPYSVPNFSLAMSTPGSPTHPPSDNDSAVTQEKFDTLKRKYDQLVRKSGKRRRCTNNPTVEERARGIRKVASSYTNISNLVVTALIQEEGGGDSDDDETAPEEERKRHRIE